MVSTQGIKKRCLITKALTNFPYSRVFICTIPVTKSPLTSAGCGTALLGEEAISL